MTEDRLREIENNRGGARCVEELIAEVRRQRQELTGEVNFETCCCDVLREERDAALASNAKHEEDERERDVAVEKAQWTVRQLRAKQNDAQQDIDRLNAENARLRRNQQSTGGRYDR